MLGLMLMWRRKGCKKAINTLLNFKSLERFAGRIDYSGQSLRCQEKYSHRMRPMEIRLTATSDGLMSPRGILFTYDSNLSG